MNSNDKQSQGHQGAQQPQQPYFPPPPGPPPVQTSQAQAQAPPLKHPDETPIPDYEIPAYHPSNPQFAPPPTTADDDIYGASPTDQHPPNIPGSTHHYHQQPEEAKKKPHRLSGLGHSFASKVAAPVNALAQKFGSEGFLPESLDKECEKAARILKAFCSKS
jgi:hypothetical protein